MKRNVKSILGAALVLLLLFLCYLGFKNLGSKDGDKNPLKTVLDGNEDGTITVKWDKKAGIDSVAVKWLDTKGSLLGRLVTTDNQVLIRQKYPGQMLTLTATPYSGGKEKIDAKYSTALYYYESTSAARSDSVGTVDIIIQKVSSGTWTGGTPESLCAACPRAQATEDFCDGTWFDTGRPATDEYYRVTAEGRRADDTPVSVVFILKAMPSGEVEYLTANPAHPCVTMIATSTTALSRVTVYDDSVLAFEMHSTENTDAIPVRGVFLRSLKNVDAFEVEKIWPCPAR